MKKAFTLAEVLITLGIIGIVAALTMPALIAKHQEKVTVTRVQKFYSTLSQSFKMAVLEYGEPENWSISPSIFGDDGKLTQDSLEGADKFTEILIKNMKVISRCKKTESCDEYSVYNLNGNTLLSTDFTGRAVFADGSQINSVWVNSSDSLIGDISYDVNGKKGPNRVGEDIFFFNVMNNGIIPQGLEGTSRFFDENCKLSSNYQYAGYGCTAWVVVNGNMDYLHCDDLSIKSGKTTCKN